MDIRQLHYFTEVARQRSFTKASEILHVSQPSISKMIKSLEQELGVVLLDRSERKLELTDAGVLVYEHAQKIMQMMDNLTSSIDELREVRRGQVRMGFLPTVGSYLFPTIIAGYKKEYPHIDIRMKEYSAKLLETQVEQGEIDLGVTVLPVDTELFAAVPLMEEDLVVIVDGEHWLASRESVDLSELKQESFILFTEEYAIHNVVRHACLQSGFEPSVAYMSSLWDFVGEMVAAQLGISVVPRAVAARLNNRRVRAVSISSPKIDWRYALIYRKDRYLSFAARQLIAYIRMHVPQAAL
jgi:DNA-binding transcriptional LysR family regulator